MSKLDSEIVKEFRNTSAYGKLEDQLLQDRDMAITKLKSVDSMDVQRITRLQAKAKYIEFLLRFVDSQKN